MIFDSRSKAGNTAMAVLFGGAALLCGAETLRDAPAVMATAAQDRQAAPGDQGVASGRREILLEADHSWNGKAYTHYPAGQPQLTMLRLTIAPHTVLPWHTHPVPNAVYVVSGALTIRDQETGRTQVLHAGEAAAESVDTIHRGETGDEPTVLLITYAGTPGVAISVPARGEKGEY